jgi:exodeoxyribonuclease V alpha subunit
MIDLALANALVSQCKRAQIAFIGDADQLPSVGAGNVLEDLVKSKVIPCAYLVECFRNDGSILSNSVVINQSRDLQELKTDNHFKTYWQKDAKEAADMAVKIYTDNVKKYTAKNMIVLAPMKGKSSGVRELNKRIQQAVNPKKDTKNEITVGGEFPVTFREGDRVIHTNHNDYELEVFNGDTGTILHIDSEVAVISMDDGRDITYPLKNMNSFELAYALTFHKSQGSEYNFVLCLLTTNDFVLLAKKLLYTGETRAKDMCIFLGQSKAYYMAINNMNGSATCRNTALDEKLRRLKEEL